MKFITLRRIICAIWGHSLIQTTCFGYWYCGRCDEQVGDSLAGIYFPTNIVIIGHNCDECRENYKKLRLRDKVLVPNPFKKKEK